jgi:hypothetical protein
MSLNLMLTKECSEAILVNKFLCDTGWPVESDGQPAKLDTNFGETQHPIEAD